MHVENIIYANNPSPDVAHIERLHEMEVDKTPTKLVMEQSHLQIIKSLSSSQLSPQPAWSADSIKDKGKGVIILLHGIFMPHLCLTNPLTWNPRSPGSWQNVFSR